MDYKTNNINLEGKTFEELLPEVNGLMFCQIGENKAVFDYTEYFEKNELEPIDYKVFMRMNKRYIEHLVDGEKAKTSELFFINKENGHILVASELTFIFLAFCNKEMCIYFNNLIGDVLSRGVAYSDGFVYSLTMSRIPSESLQEIINQRKQDEEGSEQ